MKSEHAFVTFRVAGDALIPDELTDLLGIRPSRAYAKGQSYTGTGGRPLKGRTGVWFMSSDGKVDSDRLSEHINWILGKLGPKKHELGRFIGQNSVHAVLTCFWHGPAGTRPPIISNDVVTILQEIPAGLERDFDTDDNERRVLAQSQAK
jgi:hypothetical protein